MHQINRSYHKQMGAVLLIAGTCIGSGMIALPMVLAKLGLIPSILLMLGVWYIMYYTSLINIELNLQAGHGLTLGSLGRYFSGKTAELIGVVSLKLLSYSLLAVFIYGGSSILQELLSSKLGLDYSFQSIATVYAIATILILLLPIKLLDYINRLLFIGLLLVTAALLAGLFVNINWTDLPLFSDQYTDITIWSAIIPVVFTSFGFQVIFHTLSNYCNMNKEMLKKAFFYGSLIPAIVYILWTCCILSAVSYDNPDFYATMMTGKVEIGELIEVLSGISKWHSVQLLVWCISLLAIATSVIGVGVGLSDSLKVMLMKKLPNEKAQNIASSVLTVLPAYLVVLLVPNAFIAVLGFAGMILAVIAILLPVYLLTHVKVEKLHYPELKSKFPLIISIAVGAIVIIAELFNMI